MFVAGVFLVNAFSLKAMKNGSFSKSLAENKMLIIAHRGYSSVAPENTIPAFLEAIDANADYIELDVQESKDGVVMVTHDSNLGRIYNQNVNVWELTKDELQQLRVNDANNFNGKYADATVPTLEEVLALCKGKIKVLVEPKPNGRDQRLAEATMEVIKKSGMEKDVQIHCLEYPILEQIKKIEPNMPCGFIISMSYGRYWDMAAADFFTLEQTYLSRDEVAKVHLVGKEVYIWTVNTEEDMQRALNVDGDAMITNYPIEAREEVFA
ncbi:MAG: glycerophosphodiester phosphodiesterase family protein, partial [Niameybacter sp.]